MRLEYGNGTESKQACHVIQIINLGLASFLSIFPDIGSRNTLDFECAFTTVAVMEGSSDRVHINANDHGVTWILPFGDWTGGRLVIPQLKMEVDVHPGELLGFSANLLAHYYTPEYDTRQFPLILIHAS